MTSSSCDKPYGRIYVVGNGEMFGELGRQDTQSIIHPILLDELKDEKITDTASARHHSIAINKEGNMFSWGRNNYGALGREEDMEEATVLPKIIDHPSMCHTRFSKVACGDTFSMAVSTKGQLYTWGTFVSPQSNQIIGYLPQLYIQFYPRIVHAFAQENIIEIAAGTSHCLALSDKGRVYSWGCNEQSQLGRPTNNYIYNELSPQHIKDLPGIIAISSGAFHSFAVDECGRLYAWGLNHYQQCGLFPSSDQDGAVCYSSVYITVPTLVPYFNNAKLIKIKEDMDDREELLKRANTEQIDDENMVLDDSVIRDDRYMAEHIKSFEKLYISRRGITGKRTSKHATSNINDAITDPVIKSISAGDAFTIISTSDNKLIVFGRCDEGQLGMMFHPEYQYYGEMRTEDVNRVHAIGYPTVNVWQCKEEITKAVCGNNHTFVLTKEGIVYGFGQSEYHQLGVFSKENVFFPTTFHSLCNTGKVIHASAGGRFSLFIVSN